MAKVIDIRDSESDSLFAVLLNVNNKYVAYGNTDRSKTFAKWFNNQDIDVSNLDSILPYHLFSSKPTVITSASSEYSNFIPTSILDSRENKVLIIESKSLPDDEFISSINDEFGEDGDEIDMWPVTDALIASIDVAYKQHLIDYKVKAFILDKDISSLLLHVKGVRAVWDPDTKPGGGWRCPPTAGDTAGQFTNRFGRGCTLGATRRIGRGLIAASGNDLQKLGKLGQTLESSGERRQQGRRDKYGRRYARRAANADKTRTQVVASRIAESLESGAGKLRDIGDKPSSQSRRQTRRIREATQEVEATVNRRRRGRRARSAELRETPEDSSTNLPTGKRKTPRKLRGSKPQTPPAVDRAEKRRVPKSRRRLARDMVRDVEDRTPKPPKEPKAKKERKIKGRKPRNTDRLRDRVARRLGETASEVLDETYKDPKAPTPTNAPDVDVSDTDDAPKKRRFRFVRPKKDSDRSRRRRVTLSKTNRSGLFFPAKKQTVKQKGELLPDWDTLSDDQKSSVKSEAFLALDSLDKGWRKRLGKKKKDELSEDEIIDFLAELEKTDGQRAGILKTYLHNFLVLSDIEENDDFSKFNDIKPKLRKAILDAADISGTSSIDDDANKTPAPQAPSTTKPARTPKAPPAPPAPLAPEDTDSDKVYDPADFISETAIENLGLQIDDVLNYLPKNALFKNSVREFDAQVSRDPDFQIVSKSFDDFYDNDKLEKVTGIRLKNSKVQVAAGTLQGVNLFIIEYDDADGNRKTARIYDIYDADNPTERLGLRIVPDVPVDEDGMAIREAGKDSDLPHIFIALTPKSPTAADEDDREAEKFFGDMMTSYTEARANAKTPFLNESYVKDEDSTFEVGGVSSSLVNRGGSIPSDNYVRDNADFDGMAQEISDLADMSRTGKTPKFWTDITDAYNSNDEQDLTPQEYELIGALVPPNAKDGQKPVKVMLSPDQRMIMVDFDSINGGKSRAYLVRVSQFNEDDVEVDPEIGLIKVFPFIPGDADDEPLSEDDLLHAFISVSNRKKDTTVATPETSEVSETVKDPANRAYPLRFVDTSQEESLGYSVDSVIMELFDDAEFNDIEDRFDAIVQATGAWNDITDSDEAQNNIPTLAPKGAGDDDVTVLEVLDKKNDSGDTYIQSWQYEYGSKDDRKLGRTYRIVENGELVGYRINADTSQDNPTRNWVTYKKTTSPTTTQQALRPSATGKTPVAPPQPPTQPTQPAQRKPASGSPSSWRGADVTGLIPKGDPKGTVLWVDPDTGFAVDVSDQIVVDSVDVALSATAQPLPQIVSSRGPNQVKYPSVRIDGKNQSLVPGVGTSSNPAFNTWSESVDFLVDSQLAKNAYSRPGWLNDMKGITTIGDLLEYLFPKDEPLSKGAATSFVFGSGGRGVNFPTVLSYAPSFDISDAGYSNAIKAVANLSSTAVDSAWDDANPPKTIDEYLDKLFKDNNIILPSGWKQLVRTRARNLYDWRGPRGQHASNYYGDMTLRSLINKINKAVISGDGTDYVDAFEELKSLHTSSLSTQNNLIKRFQTPGAGFKESEKRELVRHGEFVESLEKIASEVFSEDKILEEVQKSSRRAYKSYVDWSNTQIKKAVDRKAGKSRVGGGLDPTELAVVPDVTRTPNEITKIVDQHKSGKLFSDVSPLNPTPAITDDEKKLLVAMKDSYESKKLPGSTKEASSGGAAQMAALFTVNGYSDLPVQVTEEEAANMLAEKDDNGKPKWVILSRYMSPSPGVSGDDMVQQWQTGQRFAAGQGGTAYGWGDYFATGPGLNSYGSAGMVILMPINTRFADYRQMTEASSKIRDIIDGLEEAVGRSGRYGSQSAKTLDINDFDAVAEKIDFLKKSNSIDRNFNDEVRNRLGLYIDAFVDYWLQLEMSRIPNPRSDDETEYNDEIRKAQQVVMHANASTIAVFGGYDAMTSYDDPYRITDDQFTESITSVNMGSDSNIVVILNRTATATIPGVRSYQDITNFLARIADENGTRVWR